MKRLNSFLNTRKGSKILDVGTGGGNFIATLTNLFDGYGEIVGIDTSLGAIKSARESFKDERISFEQMDANKMTFEDNSFDIICLSNSLHHLENPKEIFAEMERVLAQYGIIIINEMISDGLSKRQKSHLKLHHFAAEVDRALGGTHNETFKGVEVASKLAEYSTLRVKSIFEVPSGRTGGKDENTKEEMDWLYNTIDRILNRVDELDNKMYFRKKAEKIRNYIKKNGFDSATQLVVVLG